MDVPIKISHRLSIFLAAVAQDQAIAQVLDHQVYRYVFHLIPPMLFPYRCAMWVLWIKKTGQWARLRISV
jgi:hypothetical protein